MSLTTGRAPLSPEPAGRFNPGLSSDTTYVEPFLRRVRGVLGQRTAIDSDRVLLVHRAGAPPTYAFPAEHVSGLPTRPEPAAAGYVQVAWDAVNAWYEEDQQVFGHPMNPYHRIDCFQAKRRLRVEVADTLLVDTRDVVALYETSRLPNLYVRRGAVQMDLLVPSSTTTYCPYKGTASHWTAIVGDTIVRDVAWSYDAPYPESQPIARMLSFYPERVQMLQEVPTWFPVPPPAGTPAPGDQNGKDGKDGKPNE